MVSCVLRTLEMIVSSEVIVDGIYFNAEIKGGDRAGGGRTDGHTDTQTYRELVSTRVLWTWNMLFGLGIRSSNLEYVLCSSEGAHGANLLRVDYAPAGGLANDT